MTVATFLMSEVISELNHLIHKNIEICSHELIWSDQKLDVLLIDHSKKRIEFGLFESPHTVFYHIESTKANRAPVFVRGDETEAPAHIGDMSREVLLEVTSEIDGLMAKLRDMVMELRKELESIPINPLAS